MNYNKQLKSMIEDNEISINQRIFKNIEFVTYCLYEVLDEFNFLSANLYFTQYYLRYESNCRKKKNSDIFMILRKYYHHYYSKKRIEIDFEEYFNVPEKFRMFKLINNNVVKKSVQILVDREAEYLDMLEKYRNVEIKELEYLTKEGYYERVIRTGVNYDERFKSSTFKFDIGDVINESTEKLPSYKTKVVRTLPLNFNWTNFKNSLGSKWSSRPSIDLVSCDNFDNHIKYEGQVHIAGLLGAGKSTYIIQETVRLVNKGNIKIGIVEPNVSEVIKTYESLKELGIKAVPIIGSTQLSKHLTRFSNAKLGGIESFNDLTNDSMSGIDYLSSNCLISSYANDYEIVESQYPCNRLKKDGSKKKFACPLAGSCSAFKRNIELIDADVWITTPHSLLASKANEIVDPIKRTYYELFHDCLDIIFVDEADSVQEEFDNQFITDETFYGGSNSIIDKFKRVEEVLRGHKFSNVESETHRWIVNYSHMVQLLNRVEYLIINSQSSRKYLIDDILTPRDLFKSMVGDLVDKENECSKKFIENLQAFLPLSEELQLNNELMEHELFVLYDKLTKCPNLGNANKMTEELITNYIGKYDLLIKSNSRYNRKKLFRKKLEFFIYLVLIDFYFRVQNNTINNIAHKIPEIYSIYASFRFVNTNFVHLITESIIGNIFGYKFSLDEENNLDVSLFNYSGIGRSLLEEWHQVKEELGQKGPGIVMLSGTSYAPTSAHYHIEKEPTFILKSEKAEGVIEQCILTKYDNANNPVKISGVSDRNLKKERLIELTKLLKNDFQYELEYWNNIGEDRKILVVVNSYEQCRIVGDYLRNHEFSYKVLSSNSILQEDEINTSLIESIPLLGNVDILIAPLSIISRGYNILKSNGDSYFGTAFFLIRPYITPGDMAYNYRILNSIVMPTLYKNKEKGYDFEESFGRTRKSVYSLLYEFSNKKFWKNLDKDQRTILSWFTFIPMKQAVGRMQRNGCSCRVFYCDGSFSKKDVERLTVESSMLKAWEANLRSLDTEMGRLLYGNFLSGLTKAIYNYEKMNENEEELY